MAEGRETDRTIERKFEQAGQFLAELIRNSKFRRNHRFINNKMIEKKNLTFE